MIDNRNTLAVLLKQIRKARNFDEFSDFAYRLFDWLGSEAIFLKAEELNRKYSLTYFINESTKVTKKRVLISKEQEYKNKVYPDYELGKVKEYTLSAGSENIQNIELIVFWNKSVDFDDLQMELDLLHPVLTLKMEQLQLSSKISKYEQMLESSMDVLMLIENKELEYISPQVFKYLGYSRDELQEAVASRNIFHPRDQKEIENKIIQDDKQKRPFSKREYRVKLKDGKFRWIEWLVRRIFDENGDVLRMILNFRDVTEKKEAEEEIEHQKIFLQEILDRLPVEIYLKDLKGKYIFINQSAANTLGLSPEKILGYADIEFLSRERAERYIAEDKKVFKGEPLQQILETEKQGKKIVFLENKQLIKLGKEEVLLGYSIDITEQKENEAKLIESTEFINKSIQIIPDSIFIFDLENFSYVFTNDKIFKKLGYKKSDVGKDLRAFIRKIIHKDDVEAYFDQLDDIRKGEKELYELEYRVLDIENKMHWYYSKKTPMKRNAKGQVDQFVGLTFDISDQKLREQNLVQTQEKLENAISAREEFLSMISHEIRTPLNAIVGIAGLLDQDMPESEREEMLAVLKNSGENLLLMINDILDFSKIKANQMQFDISTFNLDEMINNICRIYQPQIKEKGLVFDHEYDSRIFELLKGDPLRLSQILNNLMSNAIKFTDKGKISCAVRLIQEDKTKQVIEFRICDTGIGIPKSKQKIIFDPFRQVSSRTTRKYGGTGLGLSITKELVEKQGGVLKMASKSKEGSEFSAIMTFEKTAHKLQSVPREGTSLIPFKQGKYKILYVEDVSSNRYLMRAYCNGWKLKLDEAKSGQEALKYFKKNAYDLILMDLQMPGMDGFETFKALKKTNKKLPPTIALSADVSNKNARKIEDSGMIGYITKPIQVEVLYQRIKNVLTPDFNYQNGLNRSNQVSSKSIHNKLLGIYGNKKDYSVYINQVVKEIEEFEKEIILSIEKSNIKTLHEVCHKLIAPIGMFELFYLQDFLDALKFQLEHNSDNLNREESINRISSIFEQSKNEIRKGLIELA